MKLAAFSPLAALSDKAASLGRKVAGLPRQLRRDRSGVAYIEFAFTAPIILGLGLLGTETAFFVITHMKVSQIAMQVADNTSRVGEQDVLNARKVFERDLNESFIGAEKLGEGIGIFQRGRVIVSSLQVNDEGGQTIAWQRCRGAKVYDSVYGLEGKGKSGKDFKGMGKPGRELTASNGTAVMFVEVAYDYDSLTPFDLFDGRVISYTAAYNVRDSRDLTQIYPGGKQDLCNVYTPT